MKRCCIGVAIASLLPTLAEEIIADDDVDSMKLSFLSHSSLAVAPTCGMLSDSASKGPSAAVDGFAERTVPLYSVDDFKSHFRMRHETFRVVHHHQTNILCLLCACGFQIFSQILLSEIFLAFTSCVAYETL